jgi:hypothetical protein
LTKRSVHPETRSGDPFAFAGRIEIEEHPCGCYEGGVYLGYEDDNEAGELIEVIDRAPCRKCSK